MRICKSTRLECFFFTALGNFGQTSFISRYTGVNSRFRSNGASLLSRATTAVVSSAVSVLIVRNFFGTENKIRHRIFADYAVGDPTFVRTMGNLLGPQLLEGNEVTMLQNGEEIFPRDACGHSLRAEHDHV